MFPFCSLIFAVFAKWPPRQRHFCRHGRKNGSGKFQTVCKPGSVRVLQRWTAIPLGHALRRASRDQPGRRVENTPAPLRCRKKPAAPIRSCSRWGLPCQPCHQGCGALLPPRFTLTSGAEVPLAVCFLWHFPWGRPRRPLAGTVFPWSPDFPPPKLAPWQRPSNRLDFWSLRLLLPEGQPGAVKMDRV